MNPQITRIKQIQSKDPKTHQRIGAAMEVHSTLGHGFLEAVYHECLEIEFSKQSIPFT